MASIKLVENVGNAGWAESDGAGQEPIGCMCGEAGASSDETDCTETALSDDGTGSSQCLVERCSSLLLPTTAVAGKQGKTGGMCGKHGGEPDPELQTVQAALVQAGQGRNLKMQQIREPVAELAADEHREILQTAKQCTRCRADRFDAPERRSQART